MGCYSHNDGTFWVCTADHNRYRARVRRHGYQRYELGAERRTPRRAMRDLVEIFLTGAYKRGDILAYSSKPSYYEPVILCEITRP